jgi:predicted small secreted protein
MQNKIRNIAILAVLAGMMMLAGCNKNYYSGTGKGGKNCGCPSTKGL